MKRITILGGILLLIGLLWSGAWLFAATLIRQNVEALAVAAPGAPTLACARLDVGGYPFWFDVNCGGATVAAGDLSAEVPAIRASVLVYDPFHAVAVATGPLALADAFTGSRRRLDWQRLEASARLTGWRIARVSVIADQLALGNTVAGEVTLATAKHAEAHLLDIPEQYDPARGLAGLAAFLRLDGLNVPGLSVNEANATLEADVSKLPDDVRTYGDADALRRWQAAGGRLKLVGLKGEDGAQSFAVTGDLGLDSAFRPAGQLAIQSKGLVERFGPLVPEQWRPLVLGNPDAEDSYHQTLNFADGIVFAGLLPIGTLPPLL